MDASTGEIIYVNGDATQPIDIPGQGKQAKIIVHICNDINAWGRGFVLSLSKRWPTISQVYHTNNQTLGTNQPLIIVNEDTCVCNMIAQHGIRSKFTNNDEIPPIRYEAVRSCLSLLVEYIKKSKRDGEWFSKFDTVVAHMPRIGCGLAGGQWAEIEKIINETLVANRFKVVIYTLK